MVLVGRIQPFVKNMQGGWEEEKEGKRRVGGREEGRKGEMLRLWMKFKLSKPQGLLSGAHTTKRIQGYNPLANTEHKASDWALWETLHEAAKDRNTKQATRHQEAEA